MIGVEAQPFSFALDPSRVALVVIDMQRELLEAGGFGETLGNDFKPAQAVAPTVAALIALFRVQALIHEANDRGRESLLVEDASASYFPNFKQASIEVIRAQGPIVGWTTPPALLQKATA